MIPRYRCGLVMKEDITQRQLAAAIRCAGCGLVMKEDITQQLLAERWICQGCGLVMKEDITQRQRVKWANLVVVVW